MKRLHLPSGLQQGIAMIIQQDWSTEQAVAVVELLGDLQEVIYRHYQPQIQKVHAPGSWHRTQTHPGGRVRR